ncbi:MalY/PatB family protein [Rhizobium skierniewicense]|uniref:MalY/PatB family protein n=1 Tax=Rhizobium skierniewicense TaxID=984260 RepID=UPI0015716D9B|nr:MalY/PatB family protein [Rhizobium skierniewicense]NTF35005.1 pyridoxal phosphate-dependent aminotransferase [Rhizobium skierniewicense]
MTFNFDEVIDRRASNSMKWSSTKKYLAPEDAVYDPLPMWVADMDFKSPIPVRDALAEAVEFGIYGYAGGPTRSYNEAFCGWQRRRFGWQVDPDWIVTTSGVLSSIMAIIQAFSHPGESILIQPPVYGPFFDVPWVNGRHIVSAPLRLHQDGYVFDPIEFEKAIRPETKLFILCNPHNPTGMVWSEKDLRQLGEICLRHKLVVIANEIHQDFLLEPNVRHIPFAALGEPFSDISITCTAPTKTFNLAGLQIANIVVPNPSLRGEFRRQMTRNTVHSLNGFGMIATEVAYRHCEDWVDAMLDYVAGNRRFFAKQLPALNPALHILPAQALYLAWLDYRQLGLSETEMQRFLLRKAQVWFEPGTKFGPEGLGFLRVNLGCPRSTIDTALERIAVALETER